METMMVRPLKEENAADVLFMDDNSGNDVSQWLEDNEDYAWGLFLGDSLIGYCTIGEAFDCPKAIESYKGYTWNSLMLSDVYVKPEYRNCGYATQMVQDVLEQRNPNRQDTVFLTLLYDELSQFYEKLDFHWVDSSQQYCMVQDSMELLLENQKEHEKRER